MAARQDSNPARAMGHQPHSLRRFAGGKARGSGLEIYMLAVHMPTSENPTGTL